MKQFTIQARRVETFTIAGAYPNRLDERTVSEDLPQFHVMAWSIEEAFTKVHRILMWTEGVSYPGQITDGDRVWDLKSAREL